MRQYQEPTLFHETVGNENAALSRALRAIRDGWRFPLDRLNTYGSDRA